NTDLHILIIPAKETVDKGYQEKAIKQMPELANYNLDFEKPHRKIIQFLEENNIAYIDPLQSFKEGKERDKLYYPIDGHWTSKGHEVAALHIQGYLEKNV
ncbi:MAG: hypothetical protein QGH47_03425, partial [Candidatus Woesearchaeota archaeon]|nr:hypothetical protein [Candidatus Woesearchaeota archaeon]